MKSKDIKLLTPFKNKNAIDPESFEFLMFLV